MSQLVNKLPWKTAEQFKDAGCPPFYVVYNRVNGATEVMAVVPSHRAALEASPDGQQWHKVFCDPHTVTMLASESPKTIKCTPGLGLLVTLDELCL